MAGITVHMLTGDHIKTATAIASEALPFGICVRPRLFRLAGDHRALQDPQIAGLIQQSFAVPRAPRRPLYPTSVLLKQKSKPYETQPIGWRAKELAGDHRALQDPQIAGLIQQSFAGRFEIHRRLGLFYMRRIEREVLRPPSDRLCLVWFAFLFQPSRR
jgi:hypothetical protein